MIKKSAKKRTRLKSATATPHNYARYIKSIHLNVKCVGMCVSHIKNIHIARGGSEKCASGIFENGHMRTRIVVLPPMCSKFEASNLEV